jgi:acyl-[acyl-carrier-protein]-phospholipid O-acyltransferase/long-chain-fatty-acid--[acyl-carrier-protein] ligase
MAQNSLKNGDLVFIFPAGFLTRNGNMLSFKQGYKKIIEKTDCPIIPAHIGGTWGGIFSCYFGEPLTTFPRGFRPRLSVRFGKPLPGDTPTEQIRQKIQELSCDYYNSMKSPKRTLAYRFIKAARKYSRKKCISDESGKQMNYIKTLTASLVLADKIDTITQGQDKLGIIVPPSVGGAVTNIAVTLSNKIPVNLNYSLAPEQINSAIDQCEIKTVLTSKKLLKKLTELENVPNLVYLEDITEKITKTDKIKGFLKAKFTPINILAKTSQRTADDTGTIIFSSGSSGKPKGVMLSHHNIISNIDSMCDIFRLKSNDSLCGVLPFFHSFGFTCSLWLIIIKGVSASYVSNPLDSKAIAKTVREKKNTVLFAAPTFLVNYTKRIEPEDFSTLRFVLAGAEKLKPNVADSFEQKFGTRPREGYGATEMTPGIAFSIDDEQGPDYVHVGSKEGSVGHPVPGVAAKVIDPQTDEYLGFDQSGLLLVKGPNIMKGYLNDPDRTNEVIKDGWYVTGDIASIDEDGFITITDRLSRFSKIGGEMVPHITLEQKLHDLLNLDGHCVAVTSISDEKKGEQLVVLYTEQAGDGDKLYNAVSDSDLPNIFKPKRQNYICVQQIPTLGSGKLDLMQLKQIALSNIN